MADAQELEIRHKNRLAEIREQAALRDRGRIKSEEFDVQVENIRGENERELTQLIHDLGIENRQLDLQYNEFKNGQTLRLEGLQTQIKQQDDFFRHFWTLDEEVLKLEIILIEKAADALIAERAKEQDHTHHMAIKASEQVQDVVMAEEERRTLTHKNELDKDNFKFKEELKIELARTFGQVSQEHIDRTIEKLSIEGKI